VEGEPLGEEPHLRRDGVVALPVHDAQEAHVELGPAARVDAAAVGPDEHAPLHHLRVVPGHPQEPEGHVAHAGPEHGGRALDVHAPPPVRLLVRAEVECHGGAAVRVEHALQAAGHVPDHDEARHEEVRPAVVPGPMAVVRLQDLVPRHRAAARLEGRLGGLVVGRDGPPFGLPGLHSLGPPELIPRVWVHRRVEGGLGLARLGHTVPDLPARGLARELVAVGEGLLRHLVGLLGHRAAPAGVHVPLLVLPLGLAQDAVRARAAWVARVRAKAVVSGEGHHDGEGEALAQGAEQGHKQGVRREDAGRGQQGELPARVVVA